MALVYIIILILTILWCIYHKLLKKSPLDNIPGPKQQMLVGNVFQLDGDRMQNSLFEWSKEYGKVYKIKFFSDTFVVVNDADLLHEMMVTKGKDFAGRWYTYRSLLHSEYRSDIFNTDWGPDLQWRRKTLHRFIKQYSSGMDDIEMLSDKMATAVVEDLMLCDKDKPVDVYYKFYCFANDIICAMLHGEPLTDVEEKDTVRKLLPLFDEIFSPTIFGLLLDAMPFTRFLGNPVWKKYLELHSGKKNLIDKWLERHKTNGKECTGFIKDLLQILETDQGNQNVTHEVIRSLIWTSILAGSLTTSNTLSLLANTLVHHPHVQKSLQDEVKKVVGSDQSVRIKDRHSLPLHMATIYEINRLVDVVVFFPRKTMTDTSVNGYHLPKDTLVIPNYYAMHHEEEFWGDPFAFRPERFLDEEGNLLQADHPKRRHLKPFGAGNRVCIGEVLAINRMFLMLAKMMQNFTLRPASTMEEQPSWNVRGFRLGSGVMYPPDFKVKIEPIAKC